MKEITKTFKIYEFKELSENAKEKAKADLGIQFNLSYCQGDGVNIYGNLNLIDIFNLIKDKLSLEHQSILNNIFREYIDNIDLAINHHYTYLKLCPLDVYNVMDDAITSVYEDYFIPENNPQAERILDAMNIFSCFAYDYISEWCNDMEDYGYHYLYEISDDDMQEISTDNNWYYLENGEFYCD